MEALEKFEAAAAAVAAKVIRTSAADLERTVRTQIAAIGAAAVVCDSKLIDLSDLPSAPPAEADCGIADAAWGIAATGSIIVPMTAENRRSTSLLPPVHIAILPAVRILPDLPAALGVVAQTYMQPPDRPSSVVFITGPSRTADIELNLVLGVHGPRELHIVVVI